MVQVLNLTTYASSLEDAAVVGEALTQRFGQRGIFAPSIITGPDQPAAPRSGIYGDDDLCAFVTGLTDDGDVADMVEDAVEAFNDNFIEPAYPEAYFMGRDYGRGIN